MKTFILTIALATSSLFAAAGTPLQAPAGQTFDESMPSGANFDKADFRLWVPDDLAQAKAVVVLVPGFERRRAADGRRRVLAGVRREARSGPDGVPVH